MAVDPSPRLKLEHYRIMAQAESKMMDITAEHYKSAIPKLEAEFDEFFAEMDQFKPYDRRLIILNLIHYKNKIIHDRNQPMQNKLDRDSNNPSNRQKGYRKVNKPNNGPPPSSMPSTSANRGNYSQDNRDWDSADNYRTNRDTDEPQWGPNEPQGNPPPRPQRQPRNQNRGGQFNRDRF